MNCVRAIVGSPASRIKQAPNDELARSDSHYTNRRAGRQIPFLGEAPQPSPFNLDGSAGTQRRQGLPLKAHQAIKMVLGV